MQVGRAEREQARRHLEKVFSAKKKLLDKESSARYHIEARLSERVFLENYTMQKIHAT